MINLVMPSSEEDNHCHNNALQMLEDADKNFGMKLYEVAESQYTKLIEIYENNYDDPNTQKCVCQAFNNRGQIKYLRVDFDEAIDDYDNALKLIPSSEVILYNRGLIHYRLGRYTKAIADFNASLNINPEFKDSIDALKTARYEQSQKGDRIVS